MMNKQNILDLVESHGRKLKMYASPNYYRCEDMGRAKAFEEAYRESRNTWLDIKRGADPVKCLTALSKVPNSGNLRIYIDAILGKYDSSLGDLVKRAEMFAKNKDFVASEWVVIDNDLFFVRFGDYLNLPRVSRVSNEYLPDDRRNLTVSQKIADSLPNPTTRISASAS